MAGPSLALPMSLNNCFFPALEFIKNLASKLNPRGYIDLWQLEFGTRELQSGGILG